MEEIYVAAVFKLGIRGIQRGVSKSIWSFHFYLALLLQESLTTNKNRTPCEEEVRESLLLDVKNVAETNEKIAEMKTRALEHNYTVPIRNKRV